MPYIAPKRTGQRITARDWNALRNGAREGAQLLGGDGIETSRGAGAGATVALAPVSAAPKGAVLFINDSEGTIDYASIVQFYDFYAPGGNEDACTTGFLWRGRVPTTSGRALLGITVNSVGPGDIGWAYFAPGTTCLLRIDADQAPWYRYGPWSYAPSTYHRIGCLKGTTKGIFDGLGPFRCLTDGEEIGGGPNEWAHVLITRERGDYMYLEEFNDTLLVRKSSSAYRTIVFGKGYTITRDGPGMFSIGVE